MIDLKTENSLFQGPLTSLSLSRQVVDKVFSAGPRKTWISVGDIYWSSWHQYWALVTFSPHHNHLVVATMTATSILIISPTSPHWGNARQSAGLPAGAATTHSTTTPLGCSQVTATSPTGARTPCPLWGSGSVLPWCARSTGWGRTQHTITTHMLIGGNNDIKKYSWLVISSITVV